MDLADIYKRHRQGLFTHALSITGSAGTAEDAVQEAFARLCRGPYRHESRPGDAPPGRREIADPVAYVFAAVRSAAFDQRRRARSRGMTAAGRESLFARDAVHGANGASAAPATSAAAACPAAQAIEAEVAEGVAAAVDALPAESREVLVMRVYGGLSFAQIASVLGEPLPTVASRYRRALDRLRGRLEKLV